MHRTPASLIERLRGPVDQEAWASFVHLYTPLLFYWARRLGLQDQDAADLVQEVFTTLVQKLPEFEYDRGKSFRGWLRTVALNKWHEKGRRRALPTLEDGNAALSELAGPDDAVGWTEDEYRRELTGRALKLVQAEFRPGVWTAFWEYVVCDRPAAEVATRLGVGVGAVYAAKCRVLSRLRQAVDGLLD